MYVAVCILFAIYVVQCALCCCYVYAHACTHIRTHVNHPTPHPTPLTHTPTPHTRITTWSHTITHTQRSTSKELHDLAACLVSLTPQRPDVRAPHARQPYDGVLCMLGEGQYTSAAVQELLCVEQVVLQWAPVPLAVAFAEVCLFPPFFTSCFCVFHCVCEGGCGFVCV